MVLLLLFSYSQVMASFIVPSFAKRWTRFAFRVVSDEVVSSVMMKNGISNGGPNVTFFFNCREYGTVVSSISDTTPLTFDTASTLYIAQAGAILNGEFLVSCAEAMRNEDKKTMTQK